MGEEERAATRACSLAAASCWGRCGLAALWRRLRWIGLPRRRLRTYVLSASGLNYDPLGYSQNFDDGRLGDGECEPNFSVRFARHAGATRPQAPC
ncbi:hypothetical protein E2562_039172 [Oryza meyeriana var. granulata]|uniref:Uncharacterized protein n=1 Tax=Oryza meyeriana var. granulata TaxID=110450 RepID=A0A6G1DTM5_9ORYZ|nr:hypothetical protein E2562_039172 [Oryza meyeriana var. granulata]